MANKVTIASYVLCLNVKTKVACNLNSILAITIHEGNGIKHSTIFERETISFVQAMRDETMKDAVPVKK